MDSLFVRIYHLFLEIQAQKEAGRLESLEAGKREARGEKARGKGHGARSWEAGRHGVWRRIKAAQPILLKLHAF